MFAVSIHCQTPVWKIELYDAGGEVAWEVEALPGPNAEPDYFTPEDIATFYSSTYKVHYNS